MRVASIAVCALVGAVSCGADDSGDADSGSVRTVQISAVEYAFNASESITIEAGDTIEFAVSNDGTIDHELEVLTEANRRLGKTDRISPGGSDSVTVTFEEAGVYRVICDIDDHRSRGQQAEFTVADPG